MSFEIGTHGDFVRPDPIQHARHDKRARLITAEERTVIEDTEILALLAAQHALGLTILSDGGFRHGDYRGTVLESVEGLRRVPDAKTSAGLAVWTAAGPLRRRTPIAVPGARFLREHAVGPVSVTLPSPAHLASRMFSEASLDAHATPAALGEAFAAIIRDELVELIALGVDVIELVNPDYDRHLLGGPAGALAFADALHIDASVLSTARGTGTTLALTVGWGEHVDAPVDQARADALFALGADQFNVPFHCDAAVEQGLLRFIPADVRVGLGVVDATAVQQPASVASRVESAARRHAHITLMPSRGFHPIHYVPAPLTVAQQNDQLALLARSVRTLEGAPA